MNLKGFEQLTDIELAAGVADAISVPRADPANSFVLHSALELLARTTLLPYVDLSSRDVARRRILEIADQFEAFGEPVATPARMTFESLGQSATFLVDAIDHGELDDVDAAAAWLGRQAQPSQLASLLAEPLLPRLGAAGHAPILLWLLPRVAPRGEITGELLRGLCRELARVPHWRIHWIDDRPTGIAASGDELSRALAAAPLLGRGKNSFIFPLMSRVDTSGLAGSILGPVTTGVDIDSRARAITRLAAWSMVNEPGAEAPYGWTHCLTMPQAALQLASSCTDPSLALAVAATYVLGFRVSLADVAFDTDPDWAEPGDVGAAVSLADAISSGPIVARAAAWHLPPEAWRAAVTTLATVAATHHDAHLVKYTLACLDAAAQDPDHRRLYIIAAATLAGWWAVNPNGSAA